MGKPVVRLLLASTLLASTLLAGTFWAGLAAAGDASGWRRIHEESGIVVSVRTEPGRSLPSFRGQGEVRGSVLQVLAVVLDDARAKEWAKSADEAEVLRKIDARTEIVYSRARQTWPIRDRDLVMKREIEIVVPAQEFRVRLTCLRGEKAPLPNVVRMLDCETVFWLRRLDAERTFVEFRVRADPGGATPDWLTRWASERVPVDTLLALRRQVHKTAGSYGRELREWEHAR